MFSPEKVMALVRAAGSEQDAAIFLMAAFTGLHRGELLAEAVSVHRSATLRVSPGYLEQGTLCWPNDGLDWAPETLCAAARANALAVASPPS